MSVGGERGQRLWFDREGTTFDTNASDLKPALDPSSLSLPLVGGPVPSLIAVEEPEATIHPGALEFR